MKGWCDVCNTRVALLVQSGRLKRHRRNGVQCEGSLHAPISLKVEAP